MKKNIVVFIIAFLIVGSLFSCKKIIAAIFSGIEFNIPDIVLNIPAIPLVSPSEIDLGSFTQNINLDSIVKAKTVNVFGADIVKSVQVKNVTITVINGDDLNNLSNFEYARITLASNTNNTATEIAKITFPTSNVSSFVYTPPNSLELISYLKGSNLTYHIYGKNRKITTRPLRFVLSVLLKVN